MSNYGSTISKLLSWLLLQSRTKNVTAKTQKSLSNEFHKTTQGIGHLKN